MNKRITSLDNREIKNVIKLTNKSKLRNETRLFVIEGLRELQMAHSNGFEIKKIFCNTNIANLEIVKSLFNSEIIEVNNDVYSKISFRNSTEGLVGIVKQKDQNIEKELFGIKFKNPVGLAAGFDKNGKYIKELSLFGFSFIEIGTVTPKSQIGNPKKRLFRLKKDEAIINRLGINNDGVAVIAKR